MLVSALTPSSEKIHKIQPENVFRTTDRGRQRCRQRCRAEARPGLGSVGGQRGEEEERGYSIGG